jgi:RNA polymerase sigma-70 factor (ECF subfamily)
MDVSQAATVLVRARQGDSEAFRELVERHSRDAFGLAYRITGNEHDAEDVVQESFLRAYRQLGRFESRANFGTWLYHIVANCAIDVIRARRTHGGPGRGMALDEVMEPTADQPDPERLAGSAQIQERVAAALEELSATERAAFTLRHYEGRSIADIERILGLKTSAAKHGVFRAVKKLRAALAPLKSACVQRGR